MIAETVFPALSGFPALAALVGDRIYWVMAGDAPAAPYVVCDPIATAPSTGIDRFASYADRVSVTVDTYSASLAQSDAVLAAARAAMETIGTISSGPQSLGYDPGIGLYRSTFTADIFIPR